MHSKQRGPINQKYLIISIIGVIIFAILLSFFTLKSPDNKVSTKSQTNTTPSYKTVRKNLDQRFNENGRVVKIREDHNINDSTSTHPHTVIVIKLVDKQTKKYLKTAYEAVQSNQASEDQKAYVYAIQEIVSTEAKKLKNNYDVIQFVYKDGKKYVPVASSQKNKNIIKPVKTNQSTKKAAA